jgi:hypothetical protein
MALARRGARKIQVDHTVYRWVVSPDDGFMRIVIEKAEVQGQRLSVQIGYDDQTSSERSVQGERIIPSLIRQIILKAPSLGWAPERRGKELFLRLEGSDLLLLHPQ